MAEKNIRLTVSTPIRTVLETDVDFVLLRAATGDMGILHGHEPVAVQLDYGVLQAFTDKKPVSVLAVLGGFATVRENRVTVLTGLAEPPDKIEEAIAAREKERADNVISKRKLDMEMQRAETALRHALVHMDISAYSIIKGNQEKPE